MKAAGNLLRVDQFQQKSRKKVKGSGITLLGNENDDDEDKGSRMKSYVSLFGLICND